MEPNFLGCGGFELVGSGSRIIRPDPFFPLTRIQIRYFNLMQIQILLLQTDANLRPLVYRPSTGPIVFLCASIAKVHGPLWTFIASEIWFQCGSGTDFSLWLRIWISSDVDPDPAPWNDADSDLQHRRKLATSYMISQCRCRLHR